MATWTLEKEFRFEAAHHLPHYIGLCNRVHGHSWKGKITCQGTKLQIDGPNVGMLLDYSQLKAAVQPLLDNYLDHFDLNVTLPGLANPTSENIAAWIYQQVKKVLGPYLISVTIEETCTSRCVYTG